MDHLKSYSCNIVGNHNIKIRKQQVNAALQYAPYFLQSGTKQIKSVLFCDLGHLIFTVVPGIFDKAIVISLFGP